MKPPVVELSIFDLEREFLKDFVSPQDQQSVVKPPTGESPQVSITRPVEIPGEYWRIFMAPTSSSIDFPIGNIIGDTPMKPIPLTTLPNFHGIYSRDPNTFLFEFDIFFRGYDYIVDAQMLKIFPATLKGTALRWFMGLGGKAISSWDAMKEVFLEKYQDYYKSC